MVDKKRPAVFYIIFALIFSGSIFVSGLGLGIFINDLKSQTLSSSIEKASNNIKDTELELLLFDVMRTNLSCDYLVSKSYELGSQAGELGDKVEVFEDYNDINSKDYISLKKDYMRVLIKNWITLEQIKKICPSDYNIVLYFYHNVEECPGCMQQGTILSYYKNLMDEQLMIFSLDSSLNMSIIKALEINYDINKYPSLVINGVVYEEMVNSSKIGEILDYDSSSKA